MAVVMGNCCDVAGQQGDCVHHAEVPEPSRMTYQHVCHVQDCGCMCPADNIKISAASQGQKNDHSF